MANEEFSQSETEQLRRVFQNAALNDFPNPDRVGCPADKAILRAIATKTLPISDPAWRHTARCSPCFREVKAFETEAKALSNQWRTLTAVAVVFLVATGLLFFRSRFAAGLPAANEVAVLDLRRYTAIRSEGEKPGDGKAPVALHRGHLTVSVLLPVGAEAGQYEYKVLNDGLQMVLSGNGEATIENHSTSLTAGLNTEKLPRGHYSFWLRQPGFDWRSYQIDIR